MARMIPERPMRNATRSEQMMFGLLSSCPDDWVVLHGVPRKEKSDRNRRVPGGETDFIVCIPDKGWLVLEVKGQGVTFRNGQWYQEYRGRRKRLDETPLQQARANMFDMKDHLEEVAPQLAKCLYFSTVAFPMENIRSPEHSPSDTIMAGDCINAKRLERAIYRIIDNAVQRFRLRPRNVGNSVIDELVRHFQTTLETDTRMVLLASEREFVRLSDEQNVALSGVSLVDKVLVEGPAGSGKTLLAMHIARQAGEIGLKTLVLTSTWGQREWIQLETFGTPSLTVDIAGHWVRYINRRYRTAKMKEKAGMLEVLRSQVDELRSTIEKLQSGVGELEDAIQHAEQDDESGNEESDEDSDSVDDKKALIEEEDRVKSELVTAALDELRSDRGALPWDILIWDEFQNFPFPDTARAIIRKFGKVKVFADFQRQDVMAEIYERDLRGVVLDELGIPQVELTENRRNTANIADAIEQLTGLSTGWPIAGEGQPVEIHYYVDNGDLDDLVNCPDLKSKLENRISDLPIALGEISGRVATVLDNSPFISNTYRWESMIGGFPIRRIESGSLVDAEPLVPHVCISDIGRFKGLESPATFLIYPEPGPYSEDAKVRNLINYSALTRARSLLCIFTPEKNRDYFENMLPDAIHVPEASASG